VAALLGQPSADAAPTLCGGPVDNGLVAPLAIVPDLAAAFKRIRAYVLHPLPAAAALGGPANQPG